MEFSWKHFDSEMTFEFKNVSDHKQRGVFVT
jgi:hypothetical protein